MGKRIGIIPGPEHIRLTDYEEYKKNQHHDQILVLHLWCNQTADRWIDFDFVPQTGCDPTRIAFQSSDFA